MTTTEVTIEILCNILGKVTVRFEIQDLWLPKILAYLFYVQYGTLFIQNSEIYII